MSVTMGEKISELLKCQGIRQRQLAEAVGITEVSMSRYIKGVRTPKGPLVAKIADALHTTTDYLLGNETDMDAAAAFAKVQNIILHHGKDWPMQQKSALVYMLLAAKEEQT